MSVILTVLTVIYIACYMGLAIFSLSIFILIVLWWIHRGQDDILDGSSVTDWPGVTVQLPIYNESAVVERLICAVSNMDYPLNRLHIQVLDDSTDHTTHILQKLITDQRTRGVNISLVRRETRQGYKAGALENGLTETPHDLIAIFDADFVPPPDFLKKTIPYFLDDPKLGILQCRWTHINAEQNLITRSQAMSIDGHFVVEQSARNRANLLLSFNGTGGVWRRDAIEQSGGWYGGTLAEDLDLSYRAQMAGWHYKYLCQMAVPAELPPQIAAYKIQQARWAKGTTQTLLRLLSDLWHSSNINIVQKLMGTVHLCQYIPQPLLLIMTLISPILIWFGILQQLPLAFFGIVGLSAPMMYVISQFQLYSDWRKRLIAFPLLVAIGSGIMFNNTVAVLEAVFKRDLEFERTPKFINAKWYESPYALAPDWKLYVEILLMIYTAASGLISLELLPGMVLFFWGQTIGLAAVVLWGFTEKQKIFVMRSTTVR